MSPPKFGIFFDVVNGERFLFSTSEAAEKFLSTLSSARYFEFFIWMPGWTKWRNLDVLYRKQQAKAKTKSITIHEIVTSTQLKPIEQPPENALQSLDKPLPQKLRVTAHAAAESIAVANKVEVAPSAKESVVLTIPAAHLALQKAPAKGDPAKSGGEFNGSDFKWTNSQAQRRNSEGTISNDEHSSQTNATEALDIRRRGSQRYKSRLEFSLVSDSRIFRTYSVNVSVSGALLEDAVPPSFFSQPFEMLISVPAQTGIGFVDRMVFKGQVVGDLSNPHRITFLDPSIEVLQRLEKMIQLCTKAS